jgi:isopenicillin N synthase-like dioxygenase
VNHGIPNSLLDAVRRVGKEFFQLPLEEKQKYAVNPGDLQGYGQTYVVSERQKLDWGDSLGLIMFPSGYRDLNLWPVEPADFRYSLVPCWSIGEAFTLQIFCSY